MSFHIDKSINIFAVYRMRRPRRFARSVFDGFRDFQAETRKLMFLTFLDTVKFWKGKATSISLWDEPKTFFYSALHISSPKLNLLCNKNNCWKEYNIVVELRSWNKSTWKKYCRVVSSAVPISTINELLAFNSFSTEVPTTVVALRSLFNFGNFRIMYSQLRDWGSTLFKAD